MGDNFGDSWYELGFSSYRSSDPSLLVGKKRKKDWRAAPLCLFWTVWGERNRVTFDNEIFFAYKMKRSFICS